MKLRQRCSIGLVLLLGSLAAAAAVEVRLSQTEIQLGQAFQVTFESSGSSIAPPDLSALQADFEIVGRNVRQQSSVINGRRYQRVVLTLSLAPRRSGRLQIPSLELGGERSPSRAIEVLASAEQESQWGEGTPSTWPGIETQLPSLRGPATSEYAPPSGPTPSPPGPQDPRSPFQAPARSGETAPTDLGYQVPPGAYGSGGFQQRPAPGTASQPARVAPSFEIPERFRQSSQGAGQGERLSAHWLVPAVTVVSLSLMLAYWLRRRRQAAAPKRTHIPAPAALPAREDPAVQALRLAFEQRDVAAARTALLRWARDTWPDHPPANLSRLAMRMPQPLREAILKLDEAQYSPTPVDWKQLQAWELLHLSGAQTPDGSPARSTVAANQ